MLDRLRRKGCQSVLAAAHTSAAALQAPRGGAVPCARAIPSSGSVALSLSPAPQLGKQKANFYHKRSMHFSHDRANRPGPSSNPNPAPSPLDEITRLRELINRANATNSKLFKERILAEFEDLVPLLAFLYDPYCRLHVTSSTVHNYLRQRKKDDEWQNSQAPLMSVPSNRSRDKSRAAALRTKQEEDVREQVPATLLELFRLLATRQITGHEALAVIRNFLDQHGIMEQHEYALSGYDDPDMSTSELFRRGLLRPTSLEIFYRCLDRNLKAGFREGILRQAFAKDSPRTFGQQGRTSDTPIPFRGPFEVALGKPVTRAELPSLFGSEDAPRWFASRKLDGVRCLFVLRLQQEQIHNAPAHWKVASILALSRNGRPFSTLAVLERELFRLLPAYPGLVDLIEQARASETPSHSTGATTSPTATFILDGEVCILRPPERASSSAKKQLDASLSSVEAGPENLEQTMVEDFAAVVGLIKRHNYTISEPAFFPFDLLTLHEFTQWRSNNTHNAGGKARRNFSQRLEALESLVSFFEADAHAHKRPSLVRKLSQNMVSSSDEVERMIATASRCGWEGLVLRQDTPYEGKRSSAIRKFKEWKDAEYTVVGITTATMRLPIEGRFEEREALASIQIEHKGTRVSVGSGFTPEQRVEFARDPQRILGKVVTVEYFDESKTLAPASTRATDASTIVEQAERSEGQNEVYSLRFPRIKQIWGQERDV